MSIKRPPNPGNGFIYILSNPSMPNVYKVGMTTSSVKQRIQELSTTGVPRKFQAEKVFEIPENKLRSVEQLAHRKLKSKDLHHGKEFFEGSLHDCVTAVQDAIYEITKINSTDLIGEARQRAETEKRRREDEQRRQENERKRLAELEETIRQKNKSIDQQRESYVTQLIQEEKNKETFLEKYIYLPLGIIFFGAIGLAIMSEGGPLAWIGVPLAVWWLYNKDKNDTKERHMKTAIVRFPYVTAQTVDIKNNTNSHYLYSQNIKTQQNRNQSNSQKTNPDAKEWVILNHKIYNKRTQHLFKFGKPDPKSDWIYIFSNPDWRDPIKIKLVDVDKVEYIDSRAVVRCPKCNQRCSMPLKHTLVIECPNCKNNWTQRLVED